MKGTCNQIIIIDEAEKPLSSEDECVQEGIITHIPTINKQEHLISR